jgi:hypothetical protein
VAEKRQRDSNTVSLLDHFDVRFAALEKAINQRFDESKEAVLKAEGQMNKRLEGMNEFRDTIKDIQKASAIAAEKFIDRDNLELMLKPICDDIRGLQKIANIAEGKASKSTVWGSYALAIVSLIIAAVKVFVK